MSQYTVQNLKLTNLLVNTENPRFEPVISQLEAIHTMVRNQAGKLFNLASDVITYGLNPSDLTIVSPSKDKTGMFVVLEGNRRVTALKLLFEPDLIPSEQQNLQKKFRDLNQKSELKNYESVQCVVFSNYDDAEHWIELKHTGEMEGVGIVRWDTKQQDRFKANVGSTTASHQVVEFINQSKHFDKDVKESVKRVGITNIDRLISDPYVRGFLGVSLAKNIFSLVKSESEVAKGFSKIIRDLTSKNINVNDIYYKQDRIKYLENFAEEDIPQHKSDDKTEETNGNDKPLPKVAGTNESNKSKTSSKPSSSTRKYLIPGDFIIRIKDVRINDIYRELKKLEVDGFPNAAAVILRVFLELSIDFYSEKEQLPGANIDQSLVKKMEMIINYLQAKGTLTKHQLKPARTVLSSSSVISTETLNAYVHNRLLIPNPKDLKNAWDNLSLFVKTILLN